MATNLLDLMTPEDREKAIERGRRRMGQNKGSKISPELYTVAEAGYYFGWDAIVAIKRGYIDYVEDGVTKQSILTIDEVNALIEAARKVWYAKVIDQASGTFNAHASDSSSSFKSNMGKFIEEAEL